MSALCQWLHEQLEPLPLVNYPFDPEALPYNGIYFFYEYGETWGHGGQKPRIVRVGTHRDGNFQSRIGEHFLLDGMPAWDATRPPPHDRSIFRKNIGRALLNREKDPYLEVWEIDFMSRASHRKHGHLRDVEKEKQIEEWITGILRRDFSFRFIVLERQAQRMGLEGLERVLIGTLASCKVCQPSREWLGKHSPIEAISNGKLWQVQHLLAGELRPLQKSVVNDAVQHTEEWLGHKR